MFMLLLCLETLEGQPIPLQINPISLPLSGSGLILSLFVALSQLQWATIHPTCQDLSQLRTFAPTAWDTLSLELCMAAYFSSLPNSPPSQTTLWFITLFYLLSPFITYRNNFILFCLCLSLRVSEFLIWLPILEYQQLGQGPCHGYLPLHPKTWKSAKHLSHAQSIFVEQINESYQGGLY